MKHSGDSAVDWGSIALGPSVKFQGRAHSLDESRLVVPRVLPAHEDSAVLLRAVHQLEERDRVSRILGRRRNSVSYEEPHAGAQCRGSESIQRSDRVDVNGVGGFASHD
jgi:hypothetical protein